MWSSTSITFAARTAAEAATQRHASAAVPHVMLPARMMPVARVCTALDLSVTGPQRPMQVILHHAAAGRRRALRAHTANTFHRPTRSADLRTRARKGNARGDLPLSAGRRTRPKCALQRTQDGGCPTFLHLKGAHRSLVAVAIVASLPLAVLVRVMPGATARLRCKRKAAPFRHSQFTRTVRQWKCMREATALLRCTETACRAQSYRDMVPNSAEYR